MYNEDLKSDLINYATSAFIFSKHHIDTSVISLNRVLLLHGPPGTGKTSLCKALAQKLSIRNYSEYTHMALIEINSHSLFSKWFSESGKLVMKLFDYIRDILSSNDTLLFILIGCLALPLNHIQMKSNRSLLRGKPVSQGRNRPMECAS